MFFFLAWIGLWLPVGGLVAIAVRWRIGQPFTFGQKIPLVLTLYALAPGILWAIAKTQDVSLNAYGLASLRLMLPAWGIGLLIGVGSLALVWQLQWQLGWLTTRSTSVSEDADGSESNAIATPSLSFQQQLGFVLAALLLGCLVGFIEELVFRGFLQTQLQELASPWLAAAIASVAFAVSHLIWEGKAEVPQLPGLWLMGMVLVLARWVNHDQIGLAWGLHAGWVWAIATVDLLQLVQPTDSDPKGIRTWLQGRPGQPLTSGLTLLALLILATLLYIQV